MSRTLCLVLFLGIFITCSHGWYKPKPKLQKKCYSCEYSPPKMTTKTVFTTEEFEVKMPMTKVHCWFSFEVKGKVMDVDDQAQQRCGYSQPTCKTMTTYKTETKTRQVPMEVTSMTPSGGFKGCKGPVNHYNEKELGVDAWECYGNCFIRTDAHGRLTRGCFSNMNGVDPSQMGCSMQDGNMYCFCDKDRCNGQEVNMMD